MLELNVSELYKIFSEAFSEHAGFWWKLVLEEKNHAALIRSGKDHYEPVNKFPTDLISSKLSVLEDTNAKIILLIKEYASNTPSEEEAFNIALELEQSGGEIHYQTFMEKGKAETISRVFEKLNGDDKDHANRICTYMNNHDINIRNKKLNNT
ncbi:MAG: hypothetical protein R2568_08465 [Candidatus Scalindua sp.]|jgi:hypothetical protein|nr:hypothetical protein [Candidatus Scalindua sp.]MDV5166764.1 hypothetical protein [Candidatus Scalindua sp.]